MEIEPNAENATFEDLEVAMEASPTRRGFKRLAAIRALLKGFDRLSVCDLFNCSDRALRVWIHLFNAGGIDALTTKSPGGRARKIKIQRVQDLLVPVLEDPSKAGELHWTGVKLHGWIKQELGVEIGYSTTLRYLHELGYNLRVPRPWPDRQDPDEREAFLERYRRWLSEADIEVWFGDECGIEGDPRPRRRWAQRGSRPKITYCGDHVRANVIGAVCPATGENFSMIFDGVDTQVFQCFLDHFAQAVPADASKRRILILDNASWHKSNALNFHHFERAFLPAYSPDFNPIERLWLRLKADHFADFYTDNKHDLIEALCRALNAFMSDTPKVASQCAFRK